MSSSTKIYNGKNDILILEKGPTQGLEYTLIAGKIYSINFTEDNKKYLLFIMNGCAENFCKCFRSFWTNWYIFRCRLKKDIDV